MIIDVFNHFMPKAYLERLRGAHPGPRRHHGISAA